MEFDGGRLSSIVVVLHLFLAFAGQERRWKSPPQTLQLAQKWGEKPLSLMASSRTPQAELQLPRDFQGKPLDSCPLNFSHLWVSDITMMEKCMMSRDCGICTGKDVCPGRKCLCSAGEQQRLHKLNLFQQLIHFSIITGSLEVGGKRRMNLDDFPWFERQDK